MAKKESKKPEKTKEKKGKNKKGAQPAASAPAGFPASGTPSAGAPASSMPAGQSSIPLSTMSPEQMTAAQLEQAIKESNDPESRLKRLRSPINVRSCLLNILILVVLTLGIVILWCALAVDKFNFGTVFSDMMHKFGIAQAFETFWNWLTGLFS